MWLPAARDLLQKNSWRLSCLLLFQSFLSVFITFLSSYIVSTLSFNIFTLLFIPYLLRISSFSFIITDSSIHNFPISLFQSQVYFHYYQQHTHFSNLIVILILYYNMRVHKRLHSQLSQKIQDFALILFPLSICIKLFQYNA